MTITLPPDLETRLKSEAGRRGVDPAEYARNLIDSSLSTPEPVTTPIRDQVTIDLLNAWEAETATDDPEELERRRVEFEEFKASMNRNRLETEGPSSRRPFP